MIRQQSVVDCSSSGRCSSADLLAVMLQMMGSLNFNLKSLHSPLVIAEVSNAVLLEHACLRLQAPLISQYFQEVHQLAHAK